MMQRKTRLRPSLVVLSAVWFLLCACLVRKDLHLSLMFFAFVGSFLLAGAFQRTTRLPAALLPSVVGLVDCVSALICIYHGLDYTALSIMAGYLAFDHWYAALRLTLVLSWNVLEDSLTLCLALVLLATRGPTLDQESTKVQAWIVYKMLVFLFRLASSKQIPVQTTSAKIVSTEIETVPAPTALSSTTSDAEKQLWTIHGVAYDLSDFVKRHPGGADSISLGRGRDCTALFESYHPFTNQHRAILNKYHAVTKQTQTQQQTSYSFVERDRFYEVLCQRVSKTLRDKGIDPIKGRAATWQRSAYYAMIAASVLVAGIAHCRASLLGSWLFAVFGWLFGSLGHDAGHFSASRKPWINKLGLWGMSVISNPYIWQHQHTYAHHSHTNSFTLDPDLHHFETLLRVHKKFPFRSHYKLQSNVLFVLIAWTFVVFGTCFWMPWRVFQECSLYGMVTFERPVGMWLHFVGYFGIVMIVPFWVHDTWINALVSVITHVTTSGLLFALFSQINHLNESSLDTTVLKQYQSKRQIKNSWAITQIETSNNFATYSPIWHVISNGLNLQIEHHLFPGLNHCHLHHITGVVQRTCEEYGVCYKSYNGWRDVFAATLEWLDRLSKEP